ncbi:MAG: DUF6577 family protein [Flexilinea sp.]
MSQYEFVKQKILTEITPEKEFSFDDLYQIPEVRYSISKNSLKWILYKLRQDGILSSQRRGYYDIGSIKPEKIQIRDKDVEIFNKLKSAFPNLTITVWNTLFFHQYMTHQPMNHLTFVETDKDATNVVFSNLREWNDEVYINPSKNEAKKYIPGENAIVVRKAIIGMPVTEIQNIQTASPEKMLVDLFADDSILIAYKGEEMNNIFRNIFSDIRISIKTLLYYARIKGSKEELLSYLKRMKLYKAEE